MRKIVVLLTLVASFVPAAAAGARPDGIPEDPLNLCWALANTNCDLSEPLDDLPVEPEPLP